MIGVIRTAADARHRTQLPLLIESSDGRKPAGFNVPPTEEPFRISMKIREQGLVPYKVRFDPNARAWLVSAIDWKPVAAE
jgi:hypothetical protein